jgi:23S rRNA (cytosine1962-C5)-methyltransferase
MTDVVLARGREKTVVRGHPWVFSGAIARMSGDPHTDDVGTLRAHDGTFLARALLSPETRIAARVVSHLDEAIDAAFFRRRIAAAIALREALGLSSTERSCRLINGEGDGLPGLVVDRYGDILVLQATTRPMDRRKDLVVDALVTALRPSAVLEKGDRQARALEGLSPASGFLFPKTGLPAMGLPATDVPATDVPATGLPAADHGSDVDRLHRMCAELLSGQKTGQYLDQRENREVVARLAPGTEALDAFCYTGAFGLSWAQRGTRSVVFLDSSTRALSAVSARVAGLGLPVDRFSCLRGDAKSELLRLRDSGRTFDLVVLDPPKLAPSRSKLERASRAYRALNRLALSLLRPGGMLATFSCSSAMSRDLFSEILLHAATDARRQVQVLRRFSLPPDHPVPLSFPEGDYLKGLLVRAW